MPTPTLPLRALSCLGLAGLAAATPGWLSPSPEGTADLATAQDPVTQEQVRYGRDIRPLLSDRCFVCHGPDEATLKADLRLDSHTFATADLGGYRAIVPGNPDESELWYRISLDHGDSEIMPPTDSKVRPLTRDEKELIHKWIEQGAVYEDHWAFIPPERPEVPTPKQLEWVRDPMDAFVLQGLERAGLTPSAEADQATLARRVFLDLTGLPPTPEELDSYLKQAARDPEAYEALVDKILTKEPYRTRYAERMATPWLDAARYADTNGIHMDAGRQMWAWRDWVLESIRNNKPFDEFVYEQLAGDLIPNATIAQKVASGFHRNHVITDEGGAINEEYLVEYAADRTATTGAVFLGLTVECSRCHDHKFDPISQEEYFSLFAYFNSNQEPGLYSQLPNSQRAFEPFMQVPSEKQTIAQADLKKQIEQLQTEMAKPSSEDAIAYETFLSSAAQRYSVMWSENEFISAEASAGSTLTPQNDGSILASGESPAKESHTIVLRTMDTNLRTLLLEAIGDPSHTEGRVGRASNGNAVLSHIEAEAISLADSTIREPLKFTWAWADFEQADADFDVVNVLDPDHNKVWAVDAHNTPGGRNAIFLTDKPFGYPGGTDLKITLHYQSIYSEHSFGRVRLTPGNIGADGLAALPIADSRWYGTWPYKPQSEGDPGYDTVFGPEADSTIDFAKKYAPDNYSWVFVAQVKDGERVTSLPSGQAISFAGKRLFVPSERELELSLGSDDGIQVYLNGKMIHENRVNRGVAPDQEKVVIKLTPGVHTFVMKIINTGGAGGLYYEARPPQDELGGSLVFALTPESSRELGANNLAQRMSATWRTQHSPAFLAKLTKIEELATELDTIESSIPLTMVMQELESPRETFVLMRGAYDHPDKDRPVERGIPASLGSLPEGAPNDRRGLAMWLTDANNPLLARVTINRYWEMVFGSGIVETSEDFGLQGSWPSHPELLDWLAVEFRESGWDTRAILRRIVTSSTYRQDSRLRPEVSAADPGGRLLGNYPRRRLGAEEIRDQALYVSGLLVEQMGGPSVKPYQPSGLWREVAMPQSNTRNFEQGEGDDLWRRSIYTYWKRAVPPPSLLTFDAPTREFCTIRRGVTNTPLQALVLWNDEQFVESARLLSQRILAEEPPANMGELLNDATDWRIARMFRRCTSRMPETAELVRLREVLEAFQERYTNAIEDARKLISVGEAMLPAEYDPAELAAWTMLGNALLALDETISRK
ncbi:MAG: PSD1 and planctomycete cytochrome C domain-containing protein [Planctomycetes bacterium]|nr:PSD1 and planctomycete cytochrome C domain-containing protein [Planctomycetota bacterium]